MRILSKGLQRAVGKGVYNSYTKSYHNKHYFKGNFKSWSDEFLSYLKRNTI